MNAGGQTPDNSIGLNRYGAAMGNQCRGRYHEPREILATEGSGARWGRGWRL